MPTQRWSPEIPRAGSVSERGGQGEWSQVDRTGEWKGVQDRSLTEDLDRQHQARSTGGQRYQSHRAMTPRAMPRGDGMRRR